MFVYTQKKIRFSNVYMHITVQANKRFEQCELYSWFYQELEELDRLVSSWLVYSLFLYASKYALISLLSSPKDSEECID